MITKYCRVLLEEGKSPKQRYPGVAWASVALPINDDDEVILSKLGYSMVNIRKMRDVYNEFFDGFELESLRVQ